MMRVRLVWTDIKGRHYDLVADINMSLSTLDETMYRYSRWGITMEILEVR